jgi:hypothetical protein
VPRKHRLIVLILSLESLILHLPNDNTSNASSNGDEQDNDQPEPDLSVERLQDADSILKIVRTSAGRAVGSVSAGVASSRAGKTVANLEEVSGVATLASFSCGAGLATSFTSWALGVDGVLVVSDLASLGHVTASGSGTGNAS